jgi:hypothetical protein
MRSGRNVNAEGEMWMDIFLSFAKLMLADLSIQCVYRFFRGLEVVCSFEASLNSKHFSVVWVAS